MSLATPMPKTGFWPRTTAISLLLWGLLHLVGGGVLMAQAASDPAAGLQSLGSAGAIPPQPDAITAALIGFHGLNLAFAGAAVTGLSIWTLRSWPRGVTTSLIIATAADIGLIAYLLGPGHMKLTDGLWGPLLLGLAVLAGIISRRTPAPTLERTTA